MLFHMSSCLSGCYKIRDDILSKLNLQINLTVLHPNHLMPVFVETEGLCWARTAERQTSRLKRYYMRALLRQDASFFDTRNSNSSTHQVVTSISTSTHTIQDALSEKVFLIFIEIL